MLRHLFYLSLLLATKKINSTSLTEICFYDDQLQTGNDVEVLFSINSYANIIKSQYFVSSSQLRIKRSNCGPNELQNPLIESSPILDHTAEILYYPTTKFFYSKWYWTKDIFYKIDRTFSAIISFPPGVFAQDIQNKDLILPSQIADEEKLKKWLSRQEDIMKTLSCHFSQDIERIQREFCNLPYSSLIDVYNYIQRIIETEGLSDPCMKDLIILIELFGDDNRFLSCTATMLSPVPRVLLSMLQPADARFKQLHEVSMKVKAVIEKWISKTEGPYPDIYQQCLAILLKLVEKFPNEKAVVILFLKTGIDIANKNNFFDSHQEYKFRKLARIYARSYPGTIEEKMAEALLDAMASGSNVVRFIFNCLDVFYDSVDVLQKQSNEIVKPIVVLMLILLVPYWALAISRKKISVVVESHEVDALDNQILVSENKQNTNEYIKNGRIEFDSPLSSGIQRSSIGIMLESQQLAAASLQENSLSSLENG